MSIDPMVLAQAEYLKYIRRELHKIPEVGYKEFKTRELIISELKKCNADEIIDIAQTGIKAVFYGYDRDNAIAFRTELDALLMPEGTDTEYKSSHKNHMHACGHDGHMAILLALARIIGSIKKYLPTSITLLFEPDEEGIGGAARMIDEGALIKPQVTEIYGIHLMPGLPEGKIGVREGSLMAHSLEFEIIINGKSAHGATPEKGIDAIVAAAEFIQGAQSIITRMTDSDKKTVLTIGKINGGTCPNVIADKVSMQGIIRSFSDKVCSGIKDKLLARLKALENIYGIKYSFEIMLNYPAVYNNKMLFEKAIKLVNENVITPEPVMMAEDFSYFQQQIPGLFIFLGTGEDCPALHNDKFDFDESILINGLDIYVKLLLKGNECFEAV